ncbi:integral membrane sensor signal transduction histidine kinase [Ketogulonicigenium vulgare Y25]|uniref:hypothetical protein n=1 Tax=Ketogulonicigenium vulgare TaxID=92945 RepID=UPI0001E66EE3|nr:hypothetical protein [Ketogulonicigenium vulgare]ADO42453.1 integral membrane sensor signal transduction histidine kinase [Ketogulonicigenium vulgare Y25]
MISLRLRLSLVLIGSILAVVFLATVAVLHVIEPRYVDAAVVPIVNQLEGLARLAEADPDMARLAGVEIATAPFRLHEDAEAIKFLRPVAEQILPLREIVISRGSDAAYLIASMSLSDGHWMIAQVPDFSAPEDRFVLLGMWIGLITLGTAGIWRFMLRRGYRGLWRWLNAPCSGSAPMASSRMCPSLAPPKSVTWRAR